MVHVGTGLGNLGPIIPKYEDSIQNQSPNFFFNQVPILVFGFRAPVLKS